MNRYIIFSLIAAQQLFFPCYGQEKSIELEEVKVGGRRYHRAAEGALSIQLLTADSIQKYQEGSLMQTLSRLPGEGQQWGLDHGLEIDQFSVGSAEVLKGASSFLYGSDAIGGVVR